MSQLLNANNDVSFLCAFQSMRVLQQFGPVSHMGQRLAVPLFHNLQNKNDQEKTFRAILGNPLGIPAGLWQAF